RCWCGPGCRRRLRPTRYAIHSPRICSRVAPASCMSLASSATPSRRPLSPTTPTTSLAATAHWPTGPTPRELAGTQVRNACGPPLSLGLAMSRQHAFGLAQDGAGDSQQLLVEPLHARLAVRAHLRAHPGTGGATALRNLEDPAADGAGALPDLLAQPSQRAR